MKRPGSIRIAPRCLVWLAPLLLLGPKPAAAEPAPAPVAWVGQAAKPADHRTVTFTTNLLSPFFAAYYLDANLRASNRLGVLLNASYFSIDNEGWKTNTGTVGAGLSFYCQGDALRRWYVEASTEFMLSRWRHDASGKTAPLMPGFTVGSVVGYRWVSEFGPVFDLAAGAVLLHFPSARVDTDAGPISSNAFTRLYPAIKVNLGWAF
ncbi:MAG TPA: hypothetical protein VJT73_13730 [Polyangiaceae bacterium]|nr:hypothetical protein [Polyangiaceae bacterium]